MRKRIRAAFCAALAMPAVSAFAVPNQIAWPAGTQNFEDMALGDSATTIDNWVVVNTSANQPDFTIVATDNVNGGASVGHAPGSTKWLRVADVDAANIQNRFYGAFVNAPAVPGEYTWTFWVNLETAAPSSGGNTLPKIVIQHNVSATPTNVWGIQFDDTAASLAVLNAAAGTVASTPFYTIAGGTGVGSWVRIDLTADFVGGTVSAAANSGTPVSLPIAPTGALDPTTFRFCYRGEGTGNAARILVDDVSFSGQFATSGVDGWGFYE